MITFEKRAKIRNGRITLPKQARSVLSGDDVRIVVEDGCVRIEPLNELAGSLARYAQGHIPHETAREQAWSEAAHEKHIRD